MFANRFIKEKKPSLLQKLIPAAAMLLVLAVFYGSVSSLSDSSAREQKQNLEAALRKGIMQCYAFEGNYPESLSYLLAHYPVYYNEDLFFIDYQTIGQNIYPAVSVIEKK